jgi:hypothetical protein
MDEKNFRMAFPEKHRSIASMAIVANSISNIDQRLDGMDDVAFFIACELIYQFLQQKQEERERKKAKR